MGSRHISPLMSKLDAWSLLVGLLSGMPLVAVFEPGSWLGVVVGDAHGVGCPVLPQYF